MELTLHLDLQSNKVNLSVRNSNFLQNRTDTYHSEAKSKYCPRQTNIDLICCQEIKMVPDWDKLFLEQSMKSEVEQFLLHPTDPQHQPKHSHTYKHNLAQLIQTASVLFWSHDLFLKVILTPRRGLTLVGQHNTVLTHWCYSGLHFCHLQNAFSDCKWNCQ